MAVRYAREDRVRRREDPRLVTGRGKYTDDVQPERCLHAVFVRSTMAHARLASIDVSEAREIPGVEAVYAAADLHFESETARPRLCSDEVMFVGDLIAVAVASTREAAVDAAAAVIVDYEPLPVIVDPEKSDSVAMEFELGDDDALSGADVVVRGRFINQRLAPAPIEGNTVVAEPDGAGGLRMWVSTQMPFSVRGVVAHALGLVEEKVRVITGDVGGAFGAKAMTYPEQSVVAAVAMKLERPVRWFEFRSENLVAMSHGRALVSDVALGATADGKLVGLHVNTVQDAGAYAGLGPPQLILTAMLLPSVYDIPNVRFAGRCCFTNTAVVSSYRGAGRPEAIAITERAMDMLAAELHIDPADLRRRNFIGGNFPHTTPTGLTYDSGDYERALDLALQATGYDELRKEQQSRRERNGRIQLGIGISCYVEMTAVVYLDDAASATAQPDGSFVITAGTTASGQGHETAFVQIASRLLGVPSDQIRVVESDTAVVKSGHGTFGSRSLQVGGSAVRKACVELVEKAKAEAARRLEAGVEDIVQFEDGRFGVQGVPAAALSWSQLAAEAALVVDTEFEQADQTFPFGCHVAVVEVDTETGDARLVRHVAVDDCGTVLNHMLVEGQIHGGVAQGAGQALYEEFVYDADGNPLTASFVDYGIPSIGEIPRVEAVTLETPTPLNPLGAKGVGESGTIGSTPAVQNAVIDALAHLGVRHMDMPLHPMRVWEAIQDARSTSR